VFEKHGEVLGEGLPTAFLAGRGVMNLTRQQLVQRDAGPDLEVVLHEHHVVGAVVFFLGVFVFGMVDVCGVELRRLDFSLLKLGP